MTEKNYLLDIVAVGILFQTDDVEVATEELVKLQNTIFEISDVIIKDYFQKKGIPIQEYEKFVTEEAQETDESAKKIAQVLGEKELNDQIDGAVRAFLNVVFEERKALLPEAEKVRFDSYMKDIANRNKIELALFAKSLIALRKSVNSEKELDDQVKTTQAQIPNDQPPANSQTIQTSNLVSGSPQAPAQIPYMPQIHLGGVKTNPAATQPIESQQPQRQ